MYNVLWFNMCGLKKGPEKCYDSTYKVVTQLKVPVMYVKQIKSTKSSRK